MVTASVKYPGIMAYSTMSDDVAYSEVFPGCATFGGSVCEHDARIATSASMAVMQYNTFFMVYLHKYYMINITFGKNT